MLNFMINVQLARSTPIQKYNLPEPVQRAVDRYEGYSQHKHGLSWAVPSLVGTASRTDGQNLTKGLPQSIFITSTSSEDDCFALPCRRIFSFLR